MACLCEKNACGICIFNGLIATCSVFLFSEIRKWNLDVAFAKN